MNDAQFDKIMRRLDEIERLVVKASADPVATALARLDPRRPFPSDEVAGPSRAPTLRDVSR